MGILTNMVDSFFKNLQSGVADLYNQEAQKQWDIDHPAETLEDQISRKQSEQQKFLENNKKEKEAKINLEEYNKRVQKEKEEFLKNHGIK